MSNIAERLRRPDAVLDGELPFEAAAEIEQLWEANGRMAKGCESMAAENEQLRAQLKASLHAEMDLRSMSDKYPGSKPCPECGLPITACNELASQRLEIARLAQQLAHAGADIARLTRASTELLAKIEQLTKLLDAARICLKNRDQSEREAAVYADICRVLEGR